MAQARNHFHLPIRQVEKAMWKGNKAQAWPNVILWPMNMYLPNEATEIMNLLGMKTSTQPKKARVSTCATALAVTTGSVAMVMTMATLTAGDALILLATAMYKRQYLITRAPAGAAMIMQWQQQSTRQAWGYKQAQGKHKRHE